MADSDRVRVPATKKCRNGFSRVALNMGKEVECVRMVGNVHSFETFILVVTTSILNFRVGE